MSRQTTTHTKRFVRSLLSALLCSASTLALSADFAERVASEQRSAEAGLGRDGLHLLSRKAGPGAEKMAAVLLERLRALPGGVHTSDRFKREVTDKHTSLVSDDGWVLQVYGDGTRVRYRNYGDQESADKQGLPLDERFSQKELEAMGRDFVAGYLQDLVSIGPNEALIPFFTEFEITGGGPADKSERMLPERVQSSTVVFSRTVDGLPVVGPGSKVAVTFANDGDPIGFDYDWAPYAETGEVQRILPLGEIRRRGARFSPFEAGERGVHELHFECGYVDFGARKRDPAALIQGGCMRHAVKKWIVDTKEHARDARSGHALKATLDFFPAGEKMRPDATWMQAMRPDPSAEKAPGSL
ncbi:hypothetical protein GCM10011348_26830 [Marinobacterium nitratireducens]|uniref:Uncharacterized protein n=1 Tax=Marinobacterium nitratireducens TaxID=518897 RepID=A0A917ZK73_9GAMM|nr:hypothetical protein [Marinobacterium nitratireducens]GGO83327.1 hypothetical protein GCM10011348_26830 [Marinobacterium nitratireducens]